MSKVIIVESVSKKYLIKQNRPVTLKESIIRRIKRLHDPGRPLWALRDVSFSVEKGSTFGIIGHNGAGKSTLLRLVCGLGKPTSGRIQRLGKISGLLELGSGFHPDMTGRENIITGGILNGLTKSEILSREDEIINFSELEEFIDMPVRNYSTGMYMRLAFAIAMNFDPEVLIIDEVLSVGDSRFREKCITKLNSFRKSGKTLLITSHSTDEIRQLCDQVIVLEEGRLVMQGNPESAIDRYDELMCERTEKRAALVSGNGAKPSLEVDQGSRLGTREASIELTKLFDENGRVTNTINSGDGINIELEYTLSKPITDMALIFGLFNEVNIKCFETTINSVSTTLGPLKNRCRFRCHLSKLPLIPGNYYINIGLYPVNWDYIYDYHWQMHSILITSRKGINSSVTGIVPLDPNWSVYDEDQKLYV